jgi:hypothetical protein
VLLTALLGVTAAAPAYAAEAARKEDGEWRKRFHEVYRLDEGQTVKFIPAPFIPEREKFVAPFHSGPGNFGGQVTFTWDDSKQGNARLDFNTLMGIPGTVTTAFTTCGALSVADYELEGDEAARGAAVDGDWIVRKSATREERMKAVADVLRERLKIAVSAVKKKEEREVLVARGAFRHAKLEGTRNADAVHFYSDKLDPDESGGGSGNLGRLLERFESLVRYRVINEAEPHAGRIVWTEHQSASNGSNPARVDQLMKNFQDQTGLELKFEVRPVELWVIRLGEEAPAKGGL